VVDRRVRLPLSVRDAEEDGLAGAEDDLPGAVAHVKLHVEVDSFHVPGGAG